MSERQYPIQEFKSGAWQGLLPWSGPDGDQVMVQCELENPESEWPFVKIAVNLTGMEDFSVVWDSMDWRCPAPSTDRQGICAWADKLVEALAPLIGAERWPGEEKP